VKKTNLILNVFILYLFLILCSIKEALHQCVEKQSEIGFDKAAYSGLTDYAFIENRLIFGTLIAELMNIF